MLICDDSRIVRAAIGQHLRDRFELREVTDGEAAWQAILLDSSIRVVISDLTMPKVDGFELLNRVRSSKVQRIRELPMVIISGEEESGERDRRVARRYGFHPKSRRRIRAAGAHGSAGAAFDDA